MVEAFPILGQSAAPVEPSDRAFDDPAFGEHDELLDAIGSLDDFGFQIGQDCGQRAVEDRSLVGAVGEQFRQEGKQAEQDRKQRDAAVAILNVGGSHETFEQQTLRIDQNMTLLALDQFARIETVRIDARPPFSALFTLWLSMMHAVGDASRSAISRHLT